MKSLLLHTVLVLTALSSTALGERRSAIFAGTWYPSERTELVRAVNEYVSAAEGVPQDRPAAIICPHAGYQYSGGVAGYSYRAVNGHDYERVILLAPCHRYSGLIGASILDVSHYETPLGGVPLDTEVCGKLRSSSRYISSIPEAHAAEHSIEIQLPFLQRALKPGFKLVPVLIGRCDTSSLEEIADALRPFVTEQTLVLASSDFTHFGDRFGYRPFSEDVPSNIRKLDKGALDHIVALDGKGLKEYIERTGATVCGAKPIQVLLDIIDQGLKGRILKYDTSGHMTGDFSNSVSYAAVAFYRTDPDKKNEKNALESEQYLSPAEQAVLLDLSRRVLETHVRTGKRPDTENMHEITPALRKKHGVFVTLKRKGRLRGCIGYVLGVKPLFEGVIDNTVSSCSRDPRFPPVGPEELEDITISLSVMSPLISVSDVSEIKVGRDGLVIRKGGRSGVLLPQVPVEQGWNREEFLEGLSRKAGLPRGGWKNAELLRFTAQVFGEEDDE